MCVIIRPRTAADAHDCAAALRQVHDVDRYPETWPADPVGWLSPSKLIAARVAEQARVVVGHVGLGAGEETPIAVRGAVGTLAVAWVIRLYVVPSARRAGVGSHLLAAAARMAASRGQRAALSVESGGAAAIAMYERSGWRRVHSAPGGWHTAQGQKAWMHYYVSP
ncbi:GNAT family N-acetyltransferase [Nocardia sp. NBC_00508]|uniref:GNAT family N-acetyltransferase n=1 Tax=Nocardia sp. NBC_00508 TaxID=2975992 RepID=UPI002E8067CD|nr:GNAT family N-acetyltransferase [Nocardia sp. NBC_00508]WUD64993.1 GNAT family N-acetyltransferase [Nocardia sp. NBC_00508]